MQQKQLYLHLNFDKLYIVGDIDMDDNYIKIIYDSLDKPTLDESTTTMLTQFMDAYHQILDEHANALTPNPEVTAKLQVLTGPVNKAMNIPDDGKPHPAADFIKEKIINHGMEREKDFARVLKNPNAPSISYEDENPLQINGFSFAIVVVCFTIVVGMVLGALLFLIK